MRKTLSALLCGCLAMTANATELSAKSADTNRDSKVSKEDAAMVYSYILGTADIAVTLEQVDVNGDGKVNTADVVSIYAVIKQGISAGNVNVDDWTDGSNIDGGEAEETETKK